MIDMHLINMTLAGYGILTAVAVVIGAAIIAIGAIRLHGTSQRTGVAQRRELSLAGQHERIDAQVKEHQAA